MVMFLENKRGQVQKSEAYVKGTGLMVSLKKV